MPSLKFLHQTIAENFQLKVYNIARAKNWNSWPTEGMGQQAIISTFFFDIFSELGKMR